MKEWIEPRVNSVNMGFAASRDVHIIRASHSEELLTTRRVNIVLKIEIYAVRHVSTGDASFGLVRRYHLNRYTMVTHNIYVLPTVT